VLSHRVVNASPLILLSKIGRIDLLDDEGIRVVVPLTVLHEVAGLGLNDPSNPFVRAIHDAGWGILSFKPPIPESVLGWELDPGEESVLAVALENPGCEVVLDDLKGRRCAEAHGIALLGTLGVVILAKKAGRITEARPVFEELRKVGLYVAPDVLADALKKAGE
jgi:predicted nucleic acid-binding protein